MRGRTVSVDKWQSENSRKIKGTYEYPKGNDKAKEVECSPCKADYFGNKTF